MINDRASKVRSRWSVEWSGIRRKGKQEEDKECGEIFKLGLVDVSFSILLSSFVSPVPCL